LKTFLCCLGLVVFCSLFAVAQAPEVRFIADTLVIQADGTYEADPDLATMTFQIFSQDKDIKRAYATATQSMQHIVDLAGQNGLKKEDSEYGSADSCSRVRGRSQEAGSIILRSGRRCPAYPGLLSDRADP
jgi:hypothetical protein